MVEVAALALAAGAARRYRESGGAEATKLVAAWRGKPLVRHAVEAALASRARPVIVVTGHADSEVRAALAGLDVTFVHNADFARGLSTSLATGLAATPARCDGALVLLADMPEVRADILDQLIASFAAHPQAAAVVPTHQGARGNPALLGRALFEKAQHLQGDRGARALIEAAGEAVIEMCVSEPSVRLDLDTVEAFDGKEKFNESGAQ
jgi:molybdenum cofactor cytidylyltransferase